METKCVDADLLIIGGGSAGCMAAIRALELNPELKIMFFEKGDIKYSGSIARGMDALNVVAIPNFTTPELYLESVNQSCQGVLDEAPSYRLAARSFELLKTDSLSGRKRTSSSRRARQVGVIPSRESGDTSRGKPPSRSPRLVDSRRQHGAL